MTFREDASRIRTGNTGLPNPKRFQHLLNEARWDAEKLRDWLRGYVLSGLADPDAALVLDDTQAIKKGTHSVGVAPQHCGLTGQTENCQCMVMLTYASRYGHAFVDRELYLPRVWTADRDRCRLAGVPDDRGLVTKPHLAVRMLQRALSDPLLIFRWVVADSGYGRDPVLRVFCHDQRLPYPRCTRRSLVAGCKRGARLASTDRGGQFRVRVDLRGCPDPAAGASLPR